LTELHLLSKLTEQQIHQRLFDLQSNPHFSNSETQAENTFADRKIKCASVLMPLIHYENEWSLVFTRRTEQVESHKGQVSYPGGACEKGENQAEDTALREAWEELSIKREDVKILGKLKEVETISNFLVTPVVGTIPWPYHFKLSHQEVSKVFTIPLSWLIRPVNWVEKKFTRDDDQKEYSLITYNPYDGEILWGASARITHNFLKVLELIL
jgi:8-oxo-dGTP pyrophosphatase MutT (NUDIX family)